MNSEAPVPAGTTHRYLPSPSGRGAGGEGGLDPNEPVYMGVDVARFGFDKSALCVRQGERVLSMRSFDRMDTMRLVHEVLGTVRETGAEAVFVDEGGVGGGRRRPAAGARRAGLRRTLRRRARSAPRASSTGARRSSGSCAGCSTCKPSRYPRDEELAGQLLGLRYDISSSGQVRLEGKREMRKRGMPSPDKADALALAFLVPPSFGIWTGAEPFLRDDDPPRPGQPSRPSATTRRRRSRSRRPGTGTAMTGRRRTGWGRVVVMGGV